MMLKSRTSQKDRASYYKQHNQPHWKDIVLDPQNQKCQIGKRWNKHESHKN